MLVAKGLFAEGGAVKVDTGPPRAGLPVMKGLTVAKGEGAGANGTGIICAPPIGGPNWETGFEPLDGCKSSE